MMVAFACLKKATKRIKRNKEMLLIKSFTNQTKYEILALEILQENVTKEPFSLKHSKGYLDFPYQIKTYGEETMF